MKKNLLLFIFFFTMSAGALQAQLDIANTDLMGSEPADMEEIYLKTDMTNTTSDSLFLRWERVTNDIPDGWNTFICAFPGLCGLPWTNSLDFEMAPNSTSELQCHCEPNEISGVGKMTINIINNADESILGTVEVTCDAAIVAVNELEAAKIQLYPNPTADNFQLSNKEPIAHLEIYNILGRKVRTYDVDSNEYFVGDLPKGIYLVRLYAEDQSVTRTIKMKKM